MKDGFITVAAGTPKIRVADCRYNAEQIFTMIREADSQGVKILVMPDLFLQDTLLDGALDGLRTILAATRHLEILAVFGMPLRAAGKLYNCAVAIQKGEIVTIVPKTHVPVSGEANEQRWFTPLNAFDRPLNIAIPNPDEETDMLHTTLSQTVIECKGVSGLKVGIEICEDLWAADPPSRRLAEAGANIILNLAASSESVGKAAYRRQLVVSQSGRLICGYVFANAGEGESTSDVVFAGHNMIAENDAIGIDMQTDTYDQGQHLNVYGAEKLSRWFGKVLKEAYGLKDHRGEAAYDADYAALTERYEAEKQRQLSEENGA